MNDLLTPEPTEPSAEEGSTLNSQLLRLRGAADSMHTALLVWENHIDHPGARTAIHSAARVLLDAASAMPTHYDDAVVRADALAPIRETLAGHPRCDIHPDGDPITCGWKRAVASVQAALDKEDQCPG